VPCFGLSVRPDPFGHVYLEVVLFSISDTSGSFQRLATWILAPVLSSPLPPSFLRSVPRVAMELDLPPQPTPPLTDLAAAIHRAAAAAAVLSAPAPSSHAAAAVAALRDAHAAIGSFLSRLNVSYGDDHQPMADSGEELVEDGEGAQMVGEAEERLRNCGLQGSKRRKRPVPPSWPLGRRSSSSSEAAAAAAAPVPVLDVEERRRATMDLLMQFHA
jgi:hypothetical protein